MHETRLANASPTVQSLDANREEAGQRRVQLQTADAKLQERVQDLSLKRGRKQLVVAEQERLRQQRKVRAWRVHSCALLMY